MLPDDDRIVETCRSILNNFICFNVLKLCTSGNNKNKTSSVLLYFSRCKIFLSHLRNIHSTPSIKIIISFSVITGIHSLSGGGRTVSNGTTYGYVLKLPIILYFKGHYPFSFNKYIGDFKQFVNTVLSLLQIVHTSFVAHPVSYLMATRGFFSGGKMAEA